MMHYLLLFDAPSERVLPLCVARFGSSLVCDGVGDAGGVSCKLEAHQWFSRSLSVC